MTVGKTAGHEESAKMAKDAFLPPLWHTLSLSHILSSPQPWKPNVIPCRLFCPRTPVC